MKHHMQLRNRTPLVKPQEPKKDVSNANNKTNKLLSSLKELFGNNIGIEIYEQAKKYKIKYIEEIEEKGYEIVCQNQKLVLKKKNENQEDDEEEEEKENITESEFERRYTNSINKYKEQIYYDLFLDNAKGSSIQNFKKKRGRGKKLKNVESNKKDATKANKQPQLKNSTTQNKTYDQDNSSCFTSEPSSPLFTEQLMNNLKNDKSNQPTPVINSFDNDYSQNNEKDEDSESSRDSMNTPYLSDKKEGSETFQKAFKINQFDSNLNNQKEYTEQKQLNSSYTVSNQHSIDECGSKSKLNQTKMINRHKRLNTKEFIKLRFYSSSDDRHDQEEQAKIEEKQRKRKKDEEEVKQKNEEFLLLYSDFQTINIFQQYDSLFTQLKDDFMKKKEAETQSEIIPVTHSQQITKEAKKECDTQKYSPISKLIHQNKQIPKKLKSKITKKYSQINHVLRSDNFSQKFKIQFNQPLKIFNAPNWFKKD